MQYTLNHDVHNCEVFYPSANYATADHYHHSHDHASYMDQQYHEQYTTSMQYCGGHAQSAPCCMVCASPNVHTFGAVCSRRCTWVANNSCPQCGRMRSNASFFCSSNCAAEARQANWCIGCGVRQLQHGSPTCGAPQCVALGQRLAMHMPRVHVGSSPSAASSPAGRFNSSCSSHSSRASNARHSSASGGGSGHSSRRFEPHAAIALSDKAAGSVKSLLGAESKRLTAIVKIGGPAEARKQYTAYRGRVESEMNQDRGIGAPKYGHGGEGNEHRRFIPLRSECGTSVATDGTPTCGSNTCEVCTLLDCGIRATCHSAAVPAFSSVAKAAEGAADGPGASVVAVAVCRVTVGSARVVPRGDAETGGGVPAPQPNEHSTVVLHDGYDVAYVPVTEYSVDPQFLVFLRV